MPLRQTEQIQIAMAYAISCAAAIQQEPALVQRRARCQSIEHYKIGIQIPAEKQITPGLSPVDRDESAVELRDDRELLASVLRCVLRKQIVIRRSRCGQPGAQTSSPES